MKRKICILSTSYPTGLESSNDFPPGKFVHDMAKNLILSGFEVHVITHHTLKTKSHEVLDGVHVHRFHYFFPFAESLTKGAGLPENIKKTKNKFLVPFYFISLFIYSFIQIKKHKIDLINAHWVVPTGYIGLWLKKVTGKKLIVTMYGAELFPILNGNMAFLKPYIKKVINKADIVAGISEATVETAFKLSNRKDIHIIPDGIDVEYYKLANKNIEILNKYNCKNSDKVIFFTGRMVERKGHVFLIKAMKIIKDEIPNVKLILGGKGPLFNELVELRNSLGLEGQIIMPGFIEEFDLVPILQSIDLFVLPSCIDSNGDTEGSATAAFEAMACGKPALISKVGGNIGSIRDNEGGFYFEAGNANDLAEKIIYILTNEEIYKTNQQLSREFIISHYSWNKTIDKYLHAIDGLTNN